MTKRALVAIALMVLGIIGTLLMVYKVNILYINTGIVLHGLEVAYLIFSFTIIAVGKVGMLQEWGVPVGNKGPGWYFTPPGFASIKKELGTIFQDELPSDPEKIFREDGKVPEGMFPPIRIKFGQPGPTEGLSVDPIDVLLKDDPYNVAMVAEVVPVVSWHIVDATTFFAVTKDVANCRKMMADKAVGLFNIEFAGVTPAKAMLGLNETSTNLRTKLRKETKSWGIKINDAYVKPFIFGHGLNKAVEAVSISQQGAKAKVHEEEGKAAGVRIAMTAEKERLIETGLAKTDATGKKIIELLPNPNTKVMAENIGKITGTVVFGQGLETVFDLNKENKKKEKDEPKKSGEKEKGGE